jgi:hypothetical protein
VFLSTQNTALTLFPGQQIVTRLREQTNAATVWQEVEFLERGEGNTLSRLSVDISVVGESVLHCLHCLTTQSVTQNLSDGLRAVVMSFAGRTHISSCFLRYMLTNLRKKSERCSTYLYISHFSCLRSFLPYLLARLVPA